MLTKSANYKIGNEGTSREIMITPLFLQNHKEPWQPNEIYELMQISSDDNVDPINIGKIIVDENMDWHYEGDDKLSEEEVEQVARFVLMQV